MPNANNYKYPLSFDSWSNKDLSDLYKLINKRRLTSGKTVKKFEENYSKKFGHKYSVMVNSGSSANLLMISALRIFFQDRIFDKDEIIVPTLSWGTTYFPILQNKLKCRFVDIDKKSLNINIDKINEAINSKTKAILAVNILGNSCDFTNIREIARKNNLILLEDNCESLGSLYNGKFTGTFGLMSSSSFYFSHHISTIEGGMVSTNNLKIYKLLISLRSHGWSREIYVNKSNNFFDKFKFLYPGYNLRSTEINAFLGLRELKKFNKYVEIRKKNFSCFLKNMEIFKDFFSIPILNDQKYISNTFGFPILIENKRIKLLDLVNFLNKNLIETRPIVTGNFTKQPVIKFFDLNKNLIYENADFIHNNGFFIGNSNKNLKNEIEYFKKILKTFLKQKKIFN